ncbi:MAG: hypothetical protein EWM72_02978 [Nitrospira sp.]|nr:MAG: hypothetical protein EWM72_02978 [Nitrospira sp.]
MIEAIRVRGSAMWWLASILIFWTVQGCGGPVRFVRAVEENPEQVVRLEARYGQGQSHGYDGAVMPFDHPTAFGRIEMETILRGLRVQLRKSLLTLGAAESGPKEVFTESERRSFAPVLVEAFAKARPDEWVVFFLGHPRGGEADHRGGPGVTEVTSGGFLVEGRQLHLVLANYRSAVSMPLILDRMRDDPLRPAGEVFYELVPGVHQTVHQFDSIKSTWDLIKSFRAGLSALTIDYQAARIFPDESMRTPDGGHSTEERLRALRRLRDQGLVTEEEYRLKRQKLLDEL